MKKIAVDGPSGAGKSTMVKALAEKYRLLYVDTGAIYRVVGLFALRAGIGREEMGKLIPLLPEIEVSLTHDSEGQRVFLGNEDVTQLIRTPEVSLYASDVSALPEVRAKLLELQRDFARKHDVIMDGRDIGTVVLPDAELKIFLTASAEERARRRTQELLDKGMDVTYEETLRQVRERDYNDSHRAVAPLRPADDAVIVDTTGKGIEETIKLLSGLVEERFGA